MKFEKLTDDQLKMLDEVAAKWIAIGRQTGLADRPRAERALDQAYVNAKIKPVNTKFWVSSPKAGWRLSALLQVDKYAKKILDSKQAQTGDLGDVISLLGSYDEEEVGKIIADKGHYATFYGNHQRHCWLGEAECEAYKRLGVTGLEPIEPFQEMAQSCGWIWAYYDIAIFSERQSEIHIDDEGRLHSVSGPALAYPDGWGVWAVNGVRVPREWVDKKDELDPTMALTHPNMEERLALKTLIGWGRILPHINARVIDKDPDPQIGTLWEAELPDSGTERFLEAQCALGPTHFLCVDPACKTALEANAWTYGEAPGSYDLDFRT